MGDHSFEVVDSFVSESSTSSPGVAYRRSCVAAVHLTQKRVDGWFGVVVCVVGRGVDDAGGGTSGRARILAQLIRYSVDG